jgi:hypothetical protein
MQEAFIHYLWQFQFFDKSLLMTTSKELLQVINIGQHNSNAGADFTQACIIINDIKWYGNIEIHLKTSDWLAHQHQENQDYDNVILHVVWEDDLSSSQTIKRKDGTSIPVLELRQRTDKLLIERYYLLLSNKESKILCASQLPNVKRIHKIAMFEKALLQRLHRKGAEVLQLLETNKGDWEVTTYQWTAQCFGFKINSEAFLRLSKALSLIILRKYTDNLTQLEALVFGQAGFLEKEPNDDDYLRLLQKEYAYLAQKHELVNSALTKHQWKFLRLRPANFPTIRLSQFVQFFYQKQSLFSVFTQVDNFNALIAFFDVKPSIYWQEHYDFGKKSKRKIAGLGKQSIDNLMINAVVPILVAYSNYKGNDTFIERAMRFLEQIPSEQNHILANWEEVGIKITHAFDSQALIELFNHYCLPKKCLQCTIGNSIIKI